MGFIYIIQSSKTEKVYVGLTTMTIAARWNKHRAAARKYANYLTDPKNIPRPNGCPKLYAAMAKYGLETFEISILEEVPDEGLDNAEITYIAKYDAITNGYNIKEGGVSGKHLPETIEKIRVRTQAALVDKIDIMRTYDIVRGLPAHCVRIVIKGSEGIAINEHPLCTKKCFTVRTYGSIEAAKQACLTFLAELEAKGVRYEPPKEGGGLPKGLRKIKDGFAVQKIHAGKSYYRSFTRKPTDAENFQDASNYLNELLNLWKQEIKN